MEAARVGASGNNFREALLKAANMASAVTVRGAKDSFAIDLREPRDAFVSDMRKIADEVVDTGPSEQRSRLITVTASAIDAVSLRCAGER